MKIVNTVYNNILKINLGNPILLLHNVNQYDYYHQRVFSNIMSSGAVLQIYST